MIPEIPIVARKMATTGAKRNETRWVPKGCIAKRSTRIAQDIPTMVPLGDSFGTATAILRKKEAVRQTDTRIVKRGTNPPTALTTETAGVRRPSDIVKL